MTAVFVESEYEIELAGVQGPAGADGADGEIPSKSYAEFLSDATSEDTIIIYSGSYTVQNNTTVDAELRGVARQWRGGKFVRDDTATVDGGVVIQNNAGAKYVREWDGVNIVPEFYRVGSSTSFRNDVDCINAAAAQLTNGGTIGLQHGKTYWGKQINLRFGTTLSGGTVKRSQLASSLLTVQANAGATTVTVADGTKFRAGMNVQIADDVGYADTASGSSSYYIVNSVSGNVVTLHVATTNTMAVGSVLFEHAYQVACAQDAVAATDANITITGVTFDGNTAQNDHTHSWTLNNGIHLASYYQQIRIENCYFKSQPSEVITVAGKAWISRCSFLDVHGACVHGSASGLDTAEGVFIDSCTAKNVCISSAAENGHGGTLGFYTQSNATRDVQITNCRLEDLNEGYVISHITPGILIASSYVENARGIVSDIFGTDPRPAPRIVNNVFVDAGNMICGGVGDEHLNDGLTITGNSFKNSSFKIVSNKGAVVANNSFRWTSDYQTRLTATEIDSISANHGLTLSGEVLFEGNSLVNESPTSAALATGVYHAYSATLPPKSKIHNNYIEGFSIGIETAQNSQLTPTPTALAISDNTIIVPTMTGTRRGILSLMSGTRVSGNKIFAASSADAIGIRVQGVDTDTTATLIAGEVFGNTVMGCVHWLETSWYDNVIAANVYNGIYSHLTSGTRQRIGVNFEITTVDGSRVLAMETTSQFSAPRFRFSNEGGFFDQDSQNIRAITSSGNFARILPGRVGIGVAIADAAAETNTIYLSATNGKLSWKDAGGTVNALY